MGLEENVIFEEIQLKEPDIHIRIDLYNEEARHFVLIMEYVSTQMNLGGIFLCSEGEWEKAKRFFKKVYGQLASCPTKVKEFTK